LVVIAAALSGVFLADDETDLAAIFPAAPEGFFESFLSGCFLATGFAVRLDGDFFDERPDWADAGFFFAGLFAAAFAFDGLAERRFGERELSVGRFRAGFALRLGFALDLARDFFTGLEGFLAMVVLPLGRDSRRAHHCSGFSRDWGDSGKLQIITCA
jgi:hypothetical protein